MFSRVVIALVQFSPNVDTATLVLCALYPATKALYTSGSEIQVDLSSKSVQTLNPVWNYVQISAV